LNSNDKKDGEEFGEMGLLNDDNKRVATIICKTGFYLSY
jgi:hypothetical protein